MLYRLHLLWRLELIEINPRPAKLCLLYSEGKIQIGSYHTEGKCSTKKHQQATPSNMPDTIKISITGKFSPRI